MISEEQLASFEVDGYTYRLEYEFNQLIEAEEATGCNLLSAQESLGSSELTAAQLRALLFAMIVPYRGFPEKPEEQIKAMGNLLRMDTIPVIKTALTEAMALAVSREMAQRFKDILADEKKEKEPAAENPAPPVTAEA